MGPLPTTEVTEVTEQETGLDSGRDLEAEVIVYNCDCHTYQQVIDLFCRHIPGMTSAKAFELAWRIDHHGNAPVYQERESRLKRSRKTLQRVGCESPFTEQGFSIRFGCLNSTNR